MFISHKKIKGVGLSPNPQSIEVGELAINVDDGSLFTKLYNGTVQKLNTFNSPVIPQIFSDYWDLELKGSTSDPTVFYDAAQTYGTYTRIGNLVYIYGQFVLTSASGGNGYLYVSGLPFNVFTPGIVSIGNSFQWTTNAPDIGQINKAERIIFRRQNLSGSLENTPLIQCSNLSNTSQLFFSGIYSTADEV